MPNPIVGDCSKVTTGTFTATGTAPGASKFEAYQRAFAQAQTILDSYVASFVSCPASCPSPSLDMEPDYTGGAPSYVVSTDAPGVLVCTVMVSRVVNLTCSPAGN
jgi:hypothetical protein